MRCHLIVQLYVKRKYMFMLFAHKFEVFVYASLVFAFYLRLCHVFFFWQSAPKFSQTHCMCLYEHNTVKHQLSQLVGTGLDHLENQESR